MKFQHEQLMDLGQRIFAAAGCSAEEAARVSRKLVESNLVGHDSHGVIRIPSYVQWLADGKVLAGQSIEVITSDASVLVVDGKFGLGQTVGEQAIELGVQRAQQHGVAIVALRNAGHLGRIGDWAEQAAAAGLISLHFVNTSGAGMLVAPYGGIDRRLSANPLAAGVPRDGQPPLILDMSACTIAEGKIRVSLNRGEQVPEGCIIDSAGQPTTEPKDFYADPPGAILPIAGHKGFCLSMIIEMLAGALTGGSCSNPVNAGRVINGMLSILIDRGRFGADAEFFPEVSRYVEFVKSSRKSAPNGEILMPGEMECRTRAVRLEQGIDLDDVTRSQIAATADKLGVQHDLGAGSAAASQVTMPGCRPDEQTESQETQQ